MAAGYTYLIENGATFKEFALGCAHAFGVGVEMQSVPNPSYQKSIEEARAELKELEKTTPQEANAQAEEEYKKALREVEEALVDSKAQLRKYMNMLTEVTLWNPPTPNHKALKEFMISQIQEAIKWDCDLEYWENHKPTKHTGGAWLSQKCQILQNRIEHYERQYSKEVKRVKEQNDWNEALIKSLEGK